MLSVILPAYNEEKMIPIAASAISALLEKEHIDYEIIFVNDGSKDQTWNMILKESKDNRHIVAVNFSRNFGKEAAMFAGLETAMGDCCVVLDCDLQHPPGKIIEMYHLWEQGYEVIEGVKEDRGQESAFHQFAAGSFYRIISKATGIDMKASSDFKLLDRKVVDTLNQMPERNVFFRALSYWVGYKRIEVSYRVQDRVEGESKWSTKALIKYAINNIGSFSSVPLQITTFLGCFMFLISIILGVNSLIQKFTGHAQNGFTTVILLILLSSSIIMISLGIIGYYIARIYEEIKGRPRYIIKEVIRS